MIQPAHSLAGTKPNPTLELIDRMLDAALEDNALAGYVILIGHAPLTSLAHDDLAWLHGHKTYRNAAVAFSGAIPHDAILLCPAADNYQVGEVTEYLGHLDSGLFNRNTIYL